jgi:hypothetical protein
MPNPEPAGIPDDAGSPYRRGRPLSTLIAPDRRRQVALLLVGLGVIIGGSAILLVSETRKMIEVVVSPTAPREVRGTVPPPPDVTLPRVSLRGPDGVVDLPQSTPVVLNAWVQGRPDSMDAFRATRELAAAGGLRLKVPIVNVAQGKADPAWAATWGVRERLVFDPDGAAVFAPLAVGGFTTYVVDASGKVRYTDRPDRVGYAQRLERVVAEISP